MRARIADVATSAAMGIASKKAAASVSTTTATLRASASNSSWSSDPLQLTVAIAAGVCSASFVIGPWRLVQFLTTIAGPIAAGLLASGSAEYFSRGVVPCASENGRWIDSFSLVLAGSGNRLAYAVGAALAVLAIARRCIAEGKGDYNAPPRRGLSRPEATHEAPIPAPPRVTPVVAPIGGGIGEMPGHLERPLLDSPAGRSSANSGRTTSGSQATAQQFASALAASAVDKMGAARRAFRGISGDSPDKPRPPSALRVGTTSSGSMLPRAAPPPAPPSAPPRRPPSNRP